MTEVMQYIDTLTVMPDDAFICYWEKRNDELRWPQAKTFPMKRELWYNLLRLVGMVVSTFGR